MSLESFTEPVRVALDVVSEFVPLTATIVKLINLAQASECYRSECNGLALLLTAVKTIVERLQEYPRDELVQLRPLLNAPLSIITSALADGTSILDELAEKSKTFCGRVKLTVMSTPNTAKVNGVQQSLATALTILTTALSSFYGRQHADKWDIVAGALTNAAPPQDISAETAGRICRYTPAEQLTIEMPNLFYGRLHEEPVIVTVCSDGDHVSRLLRYDSELRHPSVLPIWAYCTAKSVPVVVHRLPHIVDDETVGRLSDGEILVIVRGVAGPLHRAHMKNKVHGAVVPASIALEFDGHGRVVRGMLWNFSAMKTMTSTLQRDSTLKSFYDDPSADPSQLSEASDVHALGATIAALWLRRPRKASDALVPIVNDMPENWRAIVRRMIDDDVSKRIDMGEVHRLLIELPISVCPSCHRLS